MPHIAIKVDVDTWRGTREGVPRMVQLFQQEGVNATFLFSLGPDRTGRAIKRAFRPGFFKKVSRTSVVEHYGVKTLMYGTLLPSPDIGLREAAILRSVRDAGFEVGIHCWDHIAWQDHVRGKPIDWTRRQMNLAKERFFQIFGQMPQTHGAAGWQMNDFAFEWIDEAGMAYASDGRGFKPYRVQTAKGVCAHLQLPTNLPTLDELLGLDGWTADNIHEALLNITAQGKSQYPDGSYVFTCHSELEGMKLLPAMQKMIQGWKAQGYTIQSMRSLYDSVKDSVPSSATYPLTWAEVPGRSGELVVQSALTPGTHNTLNRSTV